MTTTHPTIDGVEYEELAARFRPIFDRIAEGAPRRENERANAYEEVGWLREAGFGALRVPVEYGGSGATVTQLFRLLNELGEADSNVTQGLRAHFVNTEGLLYDHDLERRDLWLRRIGEGALLGNATTESSTAVPGRPDTEFSGDGDIWLLNGTKYYSTGTLYADWISVVGRRGDEVGFTIVAANAPGVDRRDDFGGFGQRMTASGTTVFTNVEVPADEVWFAAANASRLDPYTFDFASLVLQSAHVGIARAVVRDAVTYVSTRTRVYTHGSGPTPAQDPLVQQIIGRLSGFAFAAESTMLAAVAHLDEVNELREAGREIPAATIEAMRLAVSQAYLTVGDTVHRAATLLFDVGGASAVSEDRRLDRHWRNARTISNHNPTIYKERAIGDHLLNGTPPAFSWGVKSIAATDPS
ncbi:MAG: acyl-CoA dehydrogenase family protein [Solirubrobacteraceae bacterium]